MRHLQVLSESHKAARQDEEAHIVIDNPEFLPAVLEILERPPNPLGRLILWLIMAFLALALIWSCIGQIDVVAVAQGRVVPDGRIKTVQASDQAEVRAIYVHEGQRVKQGDPLVEFDPTVSEAQVQQARQAFRVAEIDRARAQGLLDSVDGKPHALILPEGVDAGVASTQTSIVQARIAEHIATREGLVGELNQRKRDLAMTSADAKRIEQQLPLVEDQLAGLKTLQARGFASKFRVSEVEERAIGMRQDLIVRRAEVGKSRAAVETAEQHLAGADMTFKREALDAFNEADATARVRHEELTIAEDRNKHTLLTAPASGTVQQLQVHTVGAVVKPADPILVVVPDGSKLVVEANVLNRDVGFVHEGQPVRVKLEAFPFTRYGVVDGKITFLGRDAVQDEKLGFLFPARVELSQFAVRVSQKQKVPLTAGMAVSAEIRTGRRRIIEFLLSPLARRVEEAGRER